MRPKSYLLHQPIAPICAFAVSCLVAVAAAEPVAQATSPKQNPASPTDTAGAQDLLFAPRSEGLGFFSGAAPDLVKGLALNGALAFGADRALQHRSDDPRAGIAFGSSSVFAIAPIVRTHYGWAVGASAYALALAAGTYSYTREDGSSGSSVLLGSALGLAVGEAVAHHSSRAAALQDHVMVRGKGLGLKVKF